MVTLGKVLGIGLIALGAGELLYGGYKLGVSKGWNNCLEEARKKVVSTQKSSKYRMCVVDVDKENGGLKFGCERGDVKFYYKDDDMENPEGMDDFLIDE